MLTEIASPLADTKSMLDHAWLIGDQKDAFAAVPFVASTTSVADHLENWLAGNNYRSERIRKGLYVQDSQIAVCLINQALDFLQKSLMNIAGHYILAKNGLETWARITNYYASYFSVHGLLCLQGRTITRLHLDKIVPVHLVPIDLCKHVFSITTRYVGKNPHHETPWKRFYDIYDEYAVSHRAYELVTKKTNVTDPTDESTERNSLNYAPFVGFAEIRDPDRGQRFLPLFTDYISTLEQKSTLDEFLNDLQGFATDPEYKYFARTLLKIALIGDIFLSLQNANSALRSEWISTARRWQKFLQDIFSNANNCYLLKFVPLIGT